VGAAQRSPNFSLGQTPKKCAPGGTFSTKAFSTYIYQSCCSPSEAEGNPRRLRLLYNLP
jgi:hypothetical protein